MRRLHLALPDAHLSTAQERAGKARHGRKEMRTLWVLSSDMLNAYVGSSGTAEQPWPGAAQVCRLQRIIQSKETTSKTWAMTVELAYAITSSTATEADAALLLKRWRAQWQIENGLHWVRDVTFGEDASQVFKGQAPEVFTILRNAALPLLATLRLPSLSAAMRHLSSQPHGVLALFHRLSQHLSDHPHQSGP
jgi:predicted transposase YbfD/YdcC